MGRREKLEEQQMAEGENAADVVARHGATSTSFVGSNGTIERGAKLWRAIEAGPNHCSFPSSTSCPLSTPTTNPQLVAARPTPVDPLSHDLLPCPSLSSLLHRLCNGQTFLFFDLILSTCNHQ